uniref:nectin-1-like isoform X1 n=2 Tax=Myxine glutinosa TaxID=7769 RepID=UPI00358F8BCD
MAETLIVFVVISCVIYSAHGVLSPDGQVEFSGNVTVREGKPMTLVCKYKGNSSVIMVMWHFQGNAETPSSSRPDRERFASYTPAHGSSLISLHAKWASLPASKLGPTEDSDGTLQLLETSRANAGTYFCEFTVYPMGKKIVMVEMELQVIVPPDISVSLAKPLPISPPRLPSSTLNVSPLPGTSSLVALCRSTGARPAPELSWRLSPNLDPLVSLSPNGKPEPKPQASPGGPLWTVVSELWLRPLLEADRQKAFCVATHPAFDEEWEQEVTVSILYAPEVSVEGYNGQWFVNDTGASLRCVVKSNPPATTFVWTRVNGSFPLGAKTEMDIFNFMMPLSHDMAGTYECEAHNLVGKGRARVKANIDVPPTTQPPSTPGRQFTGPIITSASSRLHQKSSFPTYMAIGIAVGLIVLVCVAVAFAVWAYHNKRCCSRSSHLYYDAAAERQMALGNSHGDSNGNENTTVTDNTTSKTALDKPWRLVNEVGPPPYSPSEDTQGSEEPFLNRPTVGTPVAPFMLNEAFGDAKPPRDPTMLPVSANFPISDARQSLPMSAVPSAPPSVLNDEYGDSEEFVTHGDGTVVALREWFV